MPENPSKEGLEQKITERILQAIREIKYGSIEITIHDAKVVQIEKKQKLRLSY